MQVKGPSSSSRWGGLPSSAPSLGFGQRTKVPALRLPAKAEAIPNLAKGSYTLRDARGTSRTSGRMSGAFTDRGSTQGSIKSKKIKPLSFDLRDQQQSAEEELADFPQPIPSEEYRNSGSSRIHSAPVRLGMTPMSLSLSDFQVSDIQRTTQSALSKPGELDNWPSTTSQGSKSFLSKLEHFIDDRIQQATDGGVEEEMLAHHEGLAQFSELFKNFKPFLSRIHQSYSKYIAYCQELREKMAKMEVEMFSIQERSQQEVRMSAQMAADSLKDMEASLLEARKQESETMARMDKMESDLKDAQNSEARQKAEVDKILETNRAYCSGYKWIIKHVLKTEEPNDLDALESVTLIQKLEKALTAEHNSRWQIEYLTSSSEVTHAKTLLEEERRLFGVETERMLTELDSLRHAESQLTRDKKELENKCENLQQQVHLQKQQIEGMYLVSLGSGEDVPWYLRSTLPTVCRTTPKDQIMKVVDGVIEKCTSDFNSGVYPNLADSLVEVLKSTFQQHTTSEWMQNFLEELEHHRNHQDCELIGSVLAATKGPHMLLHRCVYIDELVGTLARISAKINNGTAFDEIGASDLAANLAEAFPFKSQTQIDALSAVLSSENTQGQFLSISRIQKNEWNGLERATLNLLIAHEVEDLKNYATNARTSLGAAASKHKSRQTNILRINPKDLKETLLEIEPDKPNEDLAIAIWRGFKLDSYDTAYAVVVPEEDDPEGWMKKAQGEDFAVMQPVDRVLFRLSTAYLLRRSVHESADPPPLPAQAAESDGAGEEKPDLKAKRFEAIEAALKECDDHPVPRWAKASATGKDPLAVTQGKPFLNLIVSQHRANMTAKIDSAK